MYRDFGVNPVNLTKPDKVPRQYHFGRLGSFSA